MPYDPRLVAQCTEELTQHGVESLGTPESVNDFLVEKSGTALLVVNSVCGCAAGGARPAVLMALGHSNRPDRVGTVFAGQDTEATARARELFGQIPPSSPCFALFKEGQVVHFVPRHGIEGRDAQTIALDLVEAFDAHCAGAESHS